VCGGLPEVEERTGGEDGRHIAFIVRKRNFAYFTDDHHGDGRLALTVKVVREQQGALVASDPERYFVPPYLGPRGWGRPDQVPAMATTGLLRGFPPMDPKNGAP
jgi:hypothetical protein